MATDVTNPLCKRSRQTSDSTALGPNSGAAEHNQNGNRIDRSRTSWTRVSFQRISVLLIAITLTAGCKPKTTEDATADRSTSAAIPEDSATSPAAKSPAAKSPAAAAEFQFTPETYSANAEQLLAARLPAEEAAKGWVRLFDGHTLFGWEISGKANFRVEDGAIVVDEGAQCLMCTSSTWGDFEMTFEFKADAETNSGVFIRTPLEPNDVATDCYEINIAPDDNPFPTGSIVKRQKVDGPAAGPQRPGQWRKMSIIADGNDVTVSLDENVVCRYTDPADLAAQRIGLQHNSGRVEFRDLKIRPLGMKPMLDPELSQWKEYPDMPGDFSINDDGDLHVKGGRTQLETKQSYGDFFMLAQYKIDDPEMNSGIFFRCIPGDEMMGYECQINNGYKDGSRLTPFDWGTGGIFKRQEARVIAGENAQWSTVLLHASGPKIAAWVGGVAVSDWEDTREEHENPRKGKRVTPGTIMIQGHDPETDVLFRELQISTIK